MSTRNRLKRLEKLSGTVEAPTHDNAIHLIGAWLACKLERFEQLRFAKRADVSQAQAHAARRRGRVILSRTAPTHR